jgi:hypothetical protein
MGHHSPRARPDSPAHACVSIRRGCRQPADTCPHAKYRHADLRNRPRRTPRRHRHLPLHTVSTQDPRSFGPPRTSANNAACPRCRWRVRARGRRPAGRDTRQRGACSRRSGDARSSRRSATCSSAPCSDPAVLRMQGRSMEPLRRRSSGALRGSRSTVSQAAQLTHRRRARTSTEPRPQRQMCAFRAVTRGVVSGSPRRGSGSQAAQGCVWQ